MEDCSYTKMFQGCVCLTECPKLPNLKETKEIQSVKFDGFDWDKDMERAYEE